MHTEAAARVPRRLPVAAVSPASVRREPLGQALLDARRLELLILNQHASLGVHSRPQFFVWTQGLLQGLIPHRALVCALRSGEQLAFRADAFATSMPAAGAIGGMLMRDAPVLPSLIKAWKQRQFQPVVCDAGETGGLNGGGFARELAEVGASRLLVHGCQDADGEVSGLYVFACTPEPAAVEVSYLLQLCVPFMHAAWVRSQAPREGMAGSRPAPVSAGVLTVREREVLRWIYLGKSNAEIGAILRISPMTVKNHVQKILRKLDVVNRAQAVGKALDAQIITP